MKAFFIAALLTLVSVAACADTPQATEAKRILTHISEGLISGRIAKPITRSVLRARGQSAELRFTKQSDLTSDLVDRYMSRAISHFLPWDNPTRSRLLLEYTGTKYIHWSTLLWGQPPPDWKILCAETDAVHGSDWGSDVVYEAGVMEIVSRPQLDNARIPDWLYQCMEELGINKTRKPGPNGPKFFSYENTFDRTATDWEGMIGRWERDKDGKDNGSVPDITMVETQLWYAYLIAEYIDAGFEGIFFGQFGLTGARDSGNEVLWEMTQFAKRLAAARGYRRAVFLSTHHYCIPYKGQLDPNSPTIFTHMTWPSRLFYSDKNEFGMETGLNATDDGQHRTAAEFYMLVKKPPFDLPILIEIDNYGQVAKGSSIAADPEGDDEITAYMKKPHSDRVAFLRYYYHEIQTYTNKLGKQGRVHLAPSGERCGYIPYKENEGEENVIKELFAEAAAASRKAVLSSMPVSKWETYVDKTHNYSILYPGGAKVKDRSAEMKPKGAGSFWVEFSDPSKKSSYVINVRHTTLRAQSTPDDYAKSNKFLLKWDREEISGMGGFVTTTGTAAKKNVVHRALVVEGKSVWMLNLTDTSGGDLKVTKRVFDYVLWSLNTAGWRPFQ